jgi:hypothetical protein
MTAGLSLQDSTWDEMGAVLVQAVEHGVTAASPGPVPPGEHVVLAVGVAGRFASVIVLRRDEDDDMVLLDDTYFLVRDDAGRWVPPGVSGGGSNHEWILRRPDRGADHRGWGGSELVLVGGQVNFAGEDLLTDLTVMASNLVAEIDITYAGQEFRRSVPPNGVLTVPVLVSDADDDIARFIGYGHAGAQIAQVEYEPLDGGAVRPGQIRPTPGR